MCHPVRPRMTQLTVEGEGCLRLVLIDTTWSLPLEDDLPFHLKDRDPARYVSHTGKLFRVHWPKGLAKGPPIHIFFISDRPGSLTHTLPCSFTRSQSLIHSVTKQAQNMRSHTYPCALANTRRILLDFQDGGIG